MRVLNRLLAGLFGLTLAGISLLVVVEIVAALAGRGPALVPYDRWAASAELYRWNSSETLWVSAGLLTAGLILMVLQWIPRRPRVLYTEFEIAGAPKVAVDRSALEESLARAATGVEGVRRAKSRAKTRRVRTTVDVAGGGDPDTTDAVKGAVTKRLERFHLRPLPDLAVTSRTRGRAR